MTLNAFYEQRQVQVARFTPADFVAQINPTDADIEAYYKANPDKFQSAERADIEYVVLNLAAVQKDIVVPEAELKTYYEQNVQRLSGDEERRASHILLNAPKSAPAAEREAAKAKAAQLLAAVRKTPDSFAELARKNSQDTGSAAKGGDLDFFGRGAMVKVFEDTAFALKKGEISDVVESDFGFHIIRLDARARGEVLPFAAVQAPLLVAQEKAAWLRASRAFIARLAAAAEVSGITLKAA